MGLSGAAAIERVAPARMMTDSEPLTADGILGDDAAKDVRFPTRDRAQLGKGAVRNVQLYLMGRTIPIGRVCVAE